MKVARVLDDDLLAEYRDALSAQGVPLARWTTPSGSDAEIDATFEPLSLTIPEEARVVWRWHDGQPWDLGHNFLCNDSRLLSVDEAAEVTVSSRRLHDENVKELESDEDPRFKESWVPFMGPQHARMIDCSAGRYEPTPVRIVSWEDPTPPPVIADSLGDVFVFWLDLLAKGVWTWNGEGTGRTGWSRDVELLPPDMRLHPLV
jgi:hypothetical protein